MRGLFVKFRLEKEIKFLMQDQEFRRRLIIAYSTQVGPYNENGFTVRYKGYRIHFDIDPEGTKGNCVVWMGYAEEKPATQQTLLNRSDLK